MDPLPRHSLTFSVLEGEFAVARLATAAVPPPHWFALTRTAEELSVVCLAHQVPANARHETGWRMLKLHGPFDFSLTGILASFVQPLADARIPIFALSTFDTDYVMVKAADLDRALTALTAAGHQCAGSLRPST